MAAVTAALVLVPDREAGAVPEKAEAALALVSHPLTMQIWGAVCFPGQTDGKENPPLEMKARTTAFAFPGDSLASSAPLQLKQGICG
jgi:hypothetical protein